METVAENLFTYGGLFYFLHGDGHGDGRFVDKNLGRLLTIFQSIETVVETVDLSTNSTEKSRYISHSSIR